MSLTAPADSYYAATANADPDRPALAGDVSCDVCVVGGGYTGLSAALHLAERGYDTVLLEAEKIGFGASGRNGGQLGSGQRQHQDEVETLVGADDARRLWDLAEESKALSKDLIARHGIACDLKPGVLTAAHKPALARADRRYAEMLRSRYGYGHVRPVDGDEMRAMLGTTAYHGGYLDDDAAHLHPLNYALGLAAAAEQAGARLHGHSRVSKVEGSPPVVRTGGGSVRARYVVYGCNGYLGALDRRLTGRIMPINNFILATEPLGTERARALIRDDVAVADSKFIINYFRLSADGRLLFGGGETYSLRFPADLKGFVRPYMLKIYPQLADARIDHAWGGTLAITLNRLPDFGRLDGDIYYAQGFSGHGVGMATLAGTLIAEAVAGTAERFDIFARIPTRRFPGGALLRWPALILAVAYYSLRDRL